MTEASVKRVDSGTAGIKAEFLDLNHQPRLAADYLPACTVVEIQQLIRQKQDEQSTDGQGTSEPPAKKSKLKERNKKRPFDKRPHFSDKLCPSIAVERPCSYGDRCKFSHDVVKFVQSQPKFINLKCYMFETYGRCPYGITCMFSTQHISETMTNVVNQELYDKFRDRSAIRNIISKDLQIKLRKKEYSFKLANKVIKHFEEVFKDKQVPPKTGSGGKNAAVINSAINETEASASATVNSNIENCSAENLNSCPTKDVDSADKMVTNGIVLSTAASDVIVSTVESSLNTKCGDKIKSTKVETNLNINGISEMTSKRFGCLLDDDLIKTRILEKKRLDFKDKLYLAPLTTVGNLPFRRVCKRLGADITCGEMAMSANLLQGQASEWALLKRHESETFFGTQLCGSYADTMSRAAQVITDTMDVDFIDINLGCPIDLVVQKGEGCALMGRIGRFEQILHCMTSVINVPLTVKMRTGLYEDKNIAHTLLPALKSVDVAMVTIHGRSREQRYTKLADWSYIKKCAGAAKPLPIFGNGDVMSYEDYNRCMLDSGVAGCMMSRGALIKPWIFTEIKEQRHWDISATERLDIVKEFVDNGLEHWGSDEQGVANTRRFLLEWLSFLYRYIPAGILEQVPQRINEKPPRYVGRNDLETLLASPNCADWVKISEMFLGPVPVGFTFLPKHRANAYQ